MRYIEDGTMGKQIHSLMITLYENKCWLDQKEREPALRLLNSHHTLKPMHLVFESLSSLHPLAHSYVMRILIILSSRDPVIQFMSERVCNLVAGIYLGSVPFNDDTKDELAQHCPLVAHLFLLFPSPLQLSPDLWF